MALSVRSTRGYLQRSGVLNNAQNYSIRGAIYVTGDGPSGEYPVNNYLGIGGGTPRTVYENFTYPVDEGGQYIVSYRNSGGSVVEVPCGSVASTIAGVWIHYCWTHNATTGASNFYILKTGFNPSSPAYLITPSQGNTENAAWDFFSVWIEKNDPITTSITMAQTAIIFCQKELSEAEVLAQFAQRDPTTAVTAVSYTYLALMDPSNPEVDSGSTATNFTKTTTLGGFVDGGVGEPLEWQTTNALAFGAEA